MTVYLTDMGAFAAVNDAYAEFFQADPPARVAIGVAALPRALRSRSTRSSRCRGSSAVSLVVSSVHGDDPAPHR